MMRVQTRLGEKDLHTFSAFLCRSNTVTCNRARTRDSMRIALNEVETCAKANSVSTHLKEGRERCGTKLKINPLSYFPTFYAPRLLRNLIEI